MKKGYFAFPRRLWVNLPKFSKDEKVILLWIYGAVTYTGPKWGTWEGTLRDIVQKTGLKKDAANRALLSLHNEEIEYTPARSRWEKSRVRIIGYRTARDYTRDLNL